ncbi:hypothetical protein ABFS83_05G022600 [Erythranthe nasuta]
MANRNLLPPSNPLPLTTTERVVAPTRAPLQSGVHDFVTDHSLIRPASHHDQVVDHHMGATTANHHLGQQVAVPLSAPVLGRRQPGRQGDHDRSNFFSSDDNALTKQIQGTHAPDVQELDVKPLLAIVEDIMRLATPASHDTNLIPGGQIVASSQHVEKLDDKAFHNTTASGHDNNKVYDNSKIYDNSKVVYESKVYGSTYDHDADIVRVLAYPINKISCEIVCKSSAGGESHTVTMHLLNTLSNYSWAAKVVITFAAFAINYGEFWLVEHLQAKDPLAKNIATLKDLPDVMAHAGALQQKFDQVLNLLNQVLKVTHRIIEFKELPDVYISHDSPEYIAATAHIPLAVYWIIRSLLVCASTLLNLIGSGHDRYITSTAESWEISSLAHKLSIILEHLQTQFKNCRDFVEKKKEEDEYKRFVIIMQSAHVDNMKVLRAMFRSREDQRPLYHGRTKTNERLDVLRSKYVLLLISDLELPLEELHILNSIHRQQSDRHEYEVLWLPVIHDPSTTAAAAAMMTPMQEKAFHDLRNVMPWYSVEHPSLVERVAIRYIREYWKFVHMPMLVVLDPHGKPSNHDALPMIWSWGTEAFPFTGEHEKYLWASKIWNITLLADNIDARIPLWVEENKVICLYGGEDIQWIRNFTRKAREVAEALHVPLEMLYVGKRNPKEKVRSCNETIAKERLSNVFAAGDDYYDYVWFFWVRLWGLWNSRKKIGMTVENDVIMREILDVLAYDSSNHQGWAAFSWSNRDITKGNAEKLMPVLDNYAQWAYKVDRPDRFVRALDEELQGFHPEHHCTRLILPASDGQISERVVCSECGKTMDKFVLYSCCTD